MLLNHVHNHLVTYPTILIHHITRMERKYKDDVMNSSWIENCIYSLLISHSQDPFRAHEAHTPMNDPLSKIALAKILCTKLSYIENNFYLDLSLHFLNVNVHKFNANTTYPLPDSILSTSNHKIFSSI